jgi:hypothetical protein
MQQLRSVQLIRPAKQGTWQASKHVEITRFGKTSLAIARRSCSEQVSRASKGLRLTSSSIGDSQQLSRLPY